MTLSKYLSLLHSSCTLDKVVRKELFDIFYDIVYNNLSWSIDRESKYWDRIIKQYNPVKFRIVGSDLNDDKDICNSNPFYEYFDGKPGILQRVVDFIGGAKKPVAEEDMCYAISKSTNTIQRCMTEVTNKNRDENPHHLCGKHLKHFKKNGGYLRMYVNQNLIGLLSYIYFMPITLTLFFGNLIQRIQLYLTLYMQEMLEI